jgi:CRISPR-associated protein Cmr6
MKNLSRFYYKDYFSNINFEYSKYDKKDNPIPEDRKETIKIININNVAEIEKNNKILTGNSFVNEQTKEVETLIPKTFGKIQHSFSLKIMYPGLVTGIGINHEASIEEEFKLGMHFDYTYGMPVIYGSSVKGVLKYYFKEFYKEYCKSKTNLPPVDMVDNIFNGGGKSIYDRDIFFDAVITKGDHKGRILASDSITPHGDNPLKNPTPLTFLKIASGCTIEFRFKLVDSTINGKTFSAQDKLALFKKIIETVGIGAKTRVGYGQFEEVK